MKSKCPVCACIIEDNDSQLICETCDTPHHEDCWRYSGGCAIFGCRKAACRKQNNPPPITNTIGSRTINQLEMWTTFLKIHWFSFLTSGFIVFTTATMLAISIFLHSSFNSDYLLKILLNIFCKLFVESNAGEFVMYLALSLYGLLVAIDIISGIHFAGINLRLTAGKARTAKLIADRVDVNNTSYYAKIWLNLIKRTNEFLLLCILTGEVIAMANEEPLSKLSIGLVVMILFERFHMLQLFGSALEERNIMIQTFQNRLVASAKGRNIQ